jgi:hypothetical protein
MAVPRAVFSGLLLIASIGMIAAVEASSALLPPKTPIISSAGGGQTAAHVDYVRLTYATSDGESAPSAEVPNIVGAGILTRVDSPAAVPGAIGYNVYAVQNNGNTDSGHVLQNPDAIPFGTPFLEPATGWRTDGRLLAGDGGLRTIEAVPHSGGSIAAPRTPSMGGNIVFSSNDASPESVVSITTVAASASHPGTIAFTFDRNVRFRERPSFCLFASKDVAPDDPALLELRDATADRPIATLDKLGLYDLTFLGEAWHDGMQPAFDAVAGHRYEASLIVRPASMVRIDGLARQAYAMPSVAGVTIDLHVPPPSNGGGALLVRGSAVPALGIPAPADPSVGRVLYYATIVSRGNATYDGDASAVVHVPRQTCSHGLFGIAAYDLGKWRSGWMLGIARARCSLDDTLTFKVDIDELKLFAREYSLALYEERSPSAPPANAVAAAAQHQAPLLAALGDSTTLATLIMPSGVRCPLRIEPSPYCQYAFEPNENFVADGAQSAGYEIENLSSIGAQTVANSFVGQDVIDLQVPFIHPQTSVVVLSAGLLDVSENGFVDVSSRLDVLTNAIRAFAPHAKIVYVGVRYFNDTASIPQQRAAVDAWDAREAALGRRYGAFLDLRPLLPDGYASLTPDGVHLTLAAQAIVARQLAQTLGSLHTAPR